MSLSQKVFDPKTWKLQSVSQMYIFNCKCNDHYYCLPFMDTGLYLIGCWVEVFEVPDDEVVAKERGIPAIIPSIPEMIKVHQVNIDI